MIRITLYRLEVDGAWTEGIIHTFSGDKAVVENKATGELELVPITRVHLKFKVITEEWVKMQMEEHRKAQAQSVSAVPLGSGGANARFTRG